jgi:tetratricopeptide (TPR) repeat protein
VLPDSEARLHDAAAARRAGALESAREACQAVLDAHADNAAALNLMAEIATDANDADAAAWAQRAISAAPAAAAPRYTLGRIYEAQGNLDEAEVAYREAIRLAPDHAKAHNNLGCLFHLRGRLDEALACYRRALELDPVLPEANQNFGSIVRDPKALEHAIAGYRGQVAANRHDALAFNHLGNTLREAGRYPEALEALGNAVRLDASLAEAHFSRSFVLLLTGNYLDGWREYEWRWRTLAYSAPARRFRQPMWDGRHVPGRTLLLHAEQGLGDTLQFARYAPLVAANCDAVVLECQPELKTLMQSVAGIRQVVAQGEALPAFDFHLPLMSLPAVFRTTLESVPWQGRYVHPPADKVREWRAVAGASRRIKVGLAWAGRPEQWDDRKRSLSFAALAPLARARNAEFFSLQIGPAAAQAAAPPPGMALRDFTGRIRDFSDTAGLVAALDLVITADTSVAHLGGAMDVPTWVLVAHAPDWRYHLGREDNPWYPRMRLFRQDRDGDWSAPVRRAADELARLGASR